MRQALKALCMAVALGQGLVALGLGTAPAAAQEQVAGPVLKEAYDLYQGARYPEAAAKFEQGLRMNPSRGQAAVAFFLLGESYMQTGESFKAKANYEASLQADPQSQVRQQARERLGAIASAGPATGRSAGPPPAQPGAAGQVFDSTGRSPAMPPPPPPPQTAGRGQVLPPPPLGRPPQAAAAPPADIFQPGTAIKDCEACPAMVVIPPGQFQMGSHRGDDDERPVHLVTIPRPIAVGRFEVTFAEYDACVAAGGCRSNVSDRGWGRGAQPVIHVTWNDAMDYARWLSAITGRRYRLPSESEWEYAARGASQAEDVFGAGQANCEGCGSPWDGKRPAPVGRFAPNGFGLHDMLGNVWEWTLDCRNDNYRGAPPDGSPWLAGDCSRRSLRGGGYKDGASKARAAYRNKDPITDRDPDNGFRVVRELP
ncbi:MAG: SUMF1/EgtB/PvdO family nonheme iron enzyme [Alphaproteobacteria bacterium]|nr:SUMF1/EgtB/PvdO family nonheme iron enzyme [Alphaproteobacteria bacterium]